MADDKGFMELVQLHERTWGMEQYPGRPSLSELLSSPVVVMWVSEAKSAPLPTRRAAETQSVPRRFMFSVHQHADELNDIVLRMIVSGKVTPDSSRRIARVFVNQKSARIQGVRLLIAE